MPEGPSIVILREELAPFKGKKVIAASGYSKVDKELVINKKITDIKSWGKHLLICFAQGALRIHLLMFGTYRINERKETNPTLTLQFKNGEINFYTCSVKWIEDVDSTYDWSVDVMSSQWDVARARKALRASPEMQVCDALLDQDIFAGSGNIIKNEVLFRVKIHPLTQVGDLPPAKLKQLVAEVPKYAYDFLQWKKQNVLKKHWQAHTKKICPRCDIPLIKEYLGKTHRRTFYCENCQIRY